VTYASLGTYSVELTVENAAGSNTATQPDLITVATSPTASFSSSTNGLDATFDNTSIGAVSYLWDFGDGQTSTETSPTHAYDMDGTYTVVLTSTNACGSNTASEIITVITVVSKEPFNFEKIKVFPNPSSGTINIEISGLKMQIIHFELFNSIGQLVGVSDADFQAGYLKSSLDFGNLPTGLYNLRIHNKSHTTLVKVLVQ
jgi:PKD repeat protein